MQTQAQLVATRRALLEDALARIEHKVYAPSHRVWAESFDVKLGVNRSRTLRQSLDDALAQPPPPDQPACRVCALGALLVSFLDKEHPDTLDVCRADGAVNTLDATWPDYMLRDIEIAYELGAGGYSLKACAEDRRSLAFGLQFSDADVRMLAIFGRMLADPECEFQPPPVPLNDEGVLPPAIRQQYSMSMLDWCDGDYDLALDYLEGDYWPPNSSTPWDGDGDPLGTRVLAPQPRDEDGWRVEAPDVGRHNSRIEECRCIDCQRAGGQRAREQEEVEEEEESEE